MGFLVIGSDGCIGAALYRTLRARRLPVWGTTRRSGHQDPDRRLFNLEDPASIAALPELPSIRTAFLCAGVNSLRRCASEPEETHRINVASVLETARLLAACDIFVVFLSTSQVFDAVLPFPTENAHLSPLSEYGWQMAEAEKGIRGLGVLGCIVRLSKVIAPDFRLFRDWLTELRHGREISAYPDVYFAPVALEQATDALCRIGAKRECGIFHLSGDRNISYYEAALLLAREAGAPPELVRPVPSAQTGLDSEYLPAHMALSSDRTWNLTPVDDLIRSYAHES